MNIKDYQVKGSLNCDCGHCFNILDFKELKRLDEVGFYGNQVKHYSKTECPACHKETVLLLKQIGQTYAVIDIATPKTEGQENNTTTEPTSKNEEENKLSNEFVCSECGKVCKNQLGLTAHLRSHNK